MIDQTYKEILLENYIQYELSHGDLVSSSMVSDYLSSLENFDLTKPQFIAANYALAIGESSSARKFKNTFISIKQDLQALYTEMLRLSDKSITTYQRWNTESNIIEKDLVDLESRIDNLLLLAQDTDGYYSTIIDNLTDVSLTDLDLSSCLIDIGSHQATLQPTGGVSTRIFLNDINPDKDVAFRIRSTIDYIGRTDMSLSVISDVFKQGNKGWWTSVSTKKSSPVTCELDVHLSSTSIPLSKIVLEIHDSAQSGAVQITPLYSVDKINWSQFPTNTFTQEARSICVFSFSEVQVQWVKFLLTKKGPDPGISTSTYSYQFGFKEISFYHEGFLANTIQKFISRPLSVVGIDGEPEEFNKIALQTCERIETNTSIRYYVMTSNDETCPVSGLTTWTAIAPMAYKDSQFSQVVNVGDTTNYVYGDTETVVMSYDGLNSNQDYVNPAQSFHLLVWNEGTSDIDDTVVTATDKRYAFKQSSDRILNYQIDSTVNVDNASLQLFRNVGTKGLDTDDKTNYVRDILKGWGFVDPWYSCVIEILAPEGIEMNIGDSPMIIDSGSYTGKIDKSVLTGKSSTSTGIHHIKVHKDNWKNVTQGANSIAELQSTDLLYPYNHRLLIEGYTYGTLFPATSPKVYNGADLFAQYLMQEVGVFDILNNVAADKFDLFARDLDVPYTYPDALIPTTVFLLKVDNANPDFQNEKFMIRFRLINQLRKYLRLRVDLSTTVETVTPAFAGYKIKLG